MEYQNQVLHRCNRIESRCRNPTEVTAEVQFGGCGITTRQLRALVTCVDIFVDRIDDTDVVHVRFGIDGVLFRNFEPRQQDRNETRQQFMNVRWKYRAVRVARISEYFDPKSARVHGNLVKQECN